MTAYAIANLHNPAPHREVAEYIERIQATLDPYGGRFLVHGAQHEVKEGSWGGAVVVIAFPGIGQGLAGLPADRAAAGRSHRRGHHPGRRGAGRL
jgi:uncharacterized protein (DUF1330 family)